MQRRANLALSAVATLAACSLDDSASVRQADYEARGLKWPLNVDEAMIGCTELARWVEVDGVKYGLNGFASTELGYADLAPIWLVDGELLAKLKEAGVRDAPPVRVSVGDLSSEADLFCK